MAFNGGMCWRICDLKGLACSGIAFVVLVLRCWFRSLLSAVGSDSRGQVSVPVAEAYCDRDGFDRFQVHGTLKPKNAFTSPFRKICNNCNKQIPNNSSDCIICQQNTPSRHEHSLECAIEIENGTLVCTMKFPQLQQHCPAIALTTYEQYTTSISSTVFHLRRLSVQAVFTLDAYNTITEINSTQ